MGESCTVYSSINFEDKRAYTAVSRVGWLHALHDSSNNNSSRRSWKGAGVVISSVGVFQVSGKIARRGENS